MENYESVQRVACYVRVSHQEQRLRGLSPDAQRDALERYAKEHNLKIVCWYEDLGVSGRKLIRKRPMLQQMIKDAEAGMFDRIIFIKLDRYFRSVAEYYECQKILDAKNVKWTATEEVYDLTTASGRYWITQKLAMAEYEADQTGERIDLVNEYKIKTGQPLVGSHSLGIAYCVEVDDNGVKKVVPDPKTKHIVIDYINHFLTHHNKRQAHIYINTKYNTTYSYNTLAKVLTDTKIYGHYRGNDNYCKPYISKEIFDNIQCILNNNIKTSHTKRVYLFTGLIICPNCNRKLAGSFVDKQTTKKPSGKVYKYNHKYYMYRCNHAMKENTCNYRKRINENIIEDHLLKNLNRYMTAYIEDVEIEDNQKKDNDLDNKIKQVKAEITRLNNMYRKERITEDEYDKDYEELSNQLKDLESQLEPVVKRDLVVYEDLLKSNWINLYHALTRENKRSFWRRYIKHILVDKDGNFHKVIFF